MRFGLSILNVSEIESIYVLEDSKERVITTKSGKQITEKFDTEKDALVDLLNIWEAIKEAHKKNTGF